MSDSSEIIDALQRAAEGIETAYASAYRWRQNSLDLFQQSRFEIHGMRDELDEMNLLVTRSFSEASMELEMLSTMLQSTLNKHFANQSATITKLWNRYVNTRL
jgi:hypothetical protein